MEHWAPVASNTGMAVDCADVCRLFENLSRDDPAALANAILQLVNRHVAMADCTVLNFSVEGAPRVVSVASQTDTTRILQAATGFARHLSHLDRIQLHLCTLLPSQTVGCISVHRQTSTQIIDAELRRLYCHTMKTVDCLTITLKSSCREWLSVNLCRHRRQGLLNRREIDTLRRLAPLIAASLTHHDRLKNENKGGGDFSDSPYDDVEELCSRLTARERQVIRRMLEGVTTERIAADLGLKPTTVVTYRSRAYDKLGVSSRHELFAALLQRRQEANSRSRANITKREAVSESSFISPAA